MRRLILSLLATFTIGLILLVLWSRSLNRRYPALSRDDVLNDTIMSVVSDGRASARVTFRSQRKCTLPWAKVNLDSVELNLPRVVQIGDVLIKERLSDTIVLVQGKKRYTFVAYKTIQHGR